MAEGLLLDEGREGAAVADHDDGHRRVANVHHQVLVVARLCADLRLFAGVRTQSVAKIVQHGLAPEQFLRA